MQLKAMGDHPRGANKTCIVAADHALLMKVSRKTHRLEHYDCNHNNNDLILNQNTQEYKNNLTDFMLYKAF